MTTQVLIAFSLTLMAGLSTGIGSAIAFFAKRTNYSFLCVSMGFSAGVMMYVSFIEMMPSALTHFSRYCDGKYPALWTTLSFFGGIALIAIIDRFVPKAENPHEMPTQGNISFAQLSPNHNEKVIDKKILRVGLFTALVLFIHNFPEGMVTFLSGLEDASIAVPIAIAIAIHNIPEGISVSVPIYYATGSKSYAFWISFLSGLAEPVGAIIGYLILAPFINDVTYGIIFATISGIMVFISLDELLPAAEEYGKHHQTIYGLVVGMAVMALSLVLL